MSVKTDIVRHRKFGYSVDREKYNHVLVIKKDSKLSMDEMTDILKSILDERQLRGYQYGSGYQFRKVFEKKNIHISSFQIYITEDQKKIFTDKNYRLKVGIRTSRPPIPLVIYPLSMLSDVNRIYNKELSSFPIRDKVDILLEEFDKQAIILNDKISEKKRFDEKKKQRNLNCVHKGKKITDFYDFKVGDYIVVSRKSLLLAPSPARIVRMTPKTIFYTLLSVDRIRTPQIVERYFRDLKNNDHSNYRLFGVRLCENNNHLFNKRTWTDSRMMDIHGRLPIRKASDDDYMAVSAGFSTRMLSNEDIKIGLQLGHLTKINISDFDFILEKY